MITQQVGESRLAPWCFLQEETPSVLLALYSVTWVDSGGLPVTGELLLRLLMMALNCSVLFTLAGVRNPSYLCSRDVPCDPP